MANLNSAIKRIQNKGKKSVDPKKNEMTEVAPVVAKGAAMVGKAAKAVKPMAKNLRFKRPNIRSYKNPETGKVDMDRYRSDQAKYKKIQQDKKSRPDMSDVKPDGVDSKRTERGERKLRAIDKVTDKKKENIKKGLQKTGDAANVTGKVIKKTASVAKKATGGAVGAFGTSSFTKEGITFKDYLNKL